jgi:hypothetical protein
VKDKLNKNLFKSKSVNASIINFIIKFRKLKKKFKISRKN